MIRGMVHCCVAATRIICPTAVLLNVEKPRPVLSAVPTGRRLQKKIRFLKNKTKYGVHPKIMVGTGRDFV
jgi:hypothetical protein